MRKILFDLDGTLLDTLDDLADAVNAVLRKFGLKERTREQVRHFVGNGIRKLMERAVGIDKEIGQIEPEGNADVTNLEFEQIFQEFREYYVAHCRIKTKAYAGILELLEKLHMQGYQMAVVSNKNQEAVQELNQIYFSEWISVAVGGKENVPKKPAPDMVLEAVQALNCEGKHILYVGDSDVDKHTADNCGLDCVLVSWGFRERELLEQMEPLAVIDRPEELFLYL